MSERTTNIVKYGLSHCYYAKATIAVDGSATYGSPVALPGAVSLSLDAQTESTIFRADNLDYWTSLANNGYEGDLELALIPEAFRVDIMNEIADDKKVIYETTDPTPTHFALMFQFEGDIHSTRHVLYNCTAERPRVAGETTGTTVEPQTETISIKAGAIYDATTNKNLVKASTKSDTDSTTYNGWFSAVPVPVIATT